MPRGRVPRPSIAPSLSLALVSSILIALAALAPVGAAANPEAPAEITTVAAAAAPAEEAASPAATRAAERAARRAERAANSAAPSATEPAAAPAGTSHAAARQAEHAARRAERVAEREARKHAGTTGTASPSSASTNLAAGAKPSKTHAERQREAERTREQRKRERETKGRLRGEGHKEREAREAREAQEAREAAEGREVEMALGVSGSGRQGLAANGVSEAAGGQPTARAPSAAAVASARAKHAAGAHSSRVAHNKRAAPVPATAVVALGLVALTGSGAGGGEASAAARSSHGTHRPGGAGKSESPIVRTVTQIVGVIPTALWLLIGVLALAAGAFAVTSRLAARRARRLERQRRDLLADVGLLQAALLPELPERVGPVTTSAAYRPASGPGAGGDFYDVFALPDGLVAVIVGDVSGHGREALPHTTLLRYTLRAYMEAGLSPREALRAAAPSLERQLGGYFATVVLASYDPRARTLTYACAGHPHPLLSGLDPDAAVIAGSAPPIGAGKPTGSRQTVVSVPGEATACFYTDGVIEARADGPAVWAAAARSGARRRPARARCRRKRARPAHGGGAARPRRVGDRPAPRRHGRLPARSRGGSRRAPDPQRGAGARRPRNRRQARTTLPGRGRPRRGGAGLQRPDGARDRRRARQRAREA